MIENQSSYVSRAGVKLAAALDHFGLDPAGLMCADLGSSTGGFVDCLLQRGAKHVYAVDTGYGQLAWKLRQDARVTVMERSNALHVQVPEACDLVTIDLGWTRQQRAVPAALRWLKQDQASRIITLVKPHYEKPRKTGGAKRHKGQAMDRAQAEAVLGQVLEAMPGLGVAVVDHFVSPIVGSKGGNVEYLVFLERAGELETGVNKKSGQEDQQAGFCD